MNDAFFILGMKRDSMPKYKTKFNRVNGTLLSNFIRFSIFIRQRPYWIYMGNIRLFKYLMDKNYGGFYTLNRRGMTDVDNLNYQLYE